MEVEVPELSLVRGEYRRRFDQMQIRPDWLEEAKSEAAFIFANKARYEEVGEQLGIPYFVVGLVHRLEGDASFQTHLHNGDPLTARTHNKPAGRPVDGQPPFTWEDSAVDALTYEHFDNQSDWSLEAICYRLEGYNGWGTRAHGTNTPYLWSGSNNYCDADDACGKYVADGKWSSAAVSKQCGAMPVLKCLMAIDPDLPFTAPKKNPVDVPAYVADAVSMIGVAEVPGDKDNPKILWDFQLVGRTDIEHDETAWCAAFVGARLWTAGYKLPPVPRDKILLAVSYLELPITVKPGDVQVGDIRVNSRPGGAHVAIVTAVDPIKGTVEVVAGNVGNAVKRYTVPLKGGDLLGYRRPTQDPLPPKFVMKSTPIQAAVGGIAAVVTWVSGYADAAYEQVAAGAHVVGWALGMAPQVTEQVAPHLATVKVVAGWYGVSPGTWIVSAVATSSALIALYGLWKAERAK